MADKMDVNEIRRRKKRNRKLLKLFIFLVGVAVFFSLYLNRNVWIPKLQGIGSRYSTITQNEGTLAEGNFPLTISGSSDFQVEVCSGKLVILSEDMLYIYSTSGKLENSWSHGLSNTSMVANKGKILLYEEGSTKFSVYSKNNEVYENEVTDDILFGTISNDGYAALVTESDSFVCSVYIFDDDGNEVYERDCLDRLVDVAFSKNSTGCNFATLEAENGEMVSSVISSSFESTEDNWTTEASEMLCLNLYSDSDNNTYQVGDTVCDIYDSLGQQVLSYEYNCELMDYSYSSGYLSIMLNDETSHKMKVVMFNGASEPVEVYFKNNLKALYVSDGNTFVMSSDGIEEYTSDGTLISQVELDDAYSDFFRLDNYAFLVGYNEINRIDFKE